ncbi:MAG: hypothetical protein IJB65_08040 [Clostridia bacterium]|nr:hypothetical protein [Clostridia bacterium]
MFTNEFILLCQAYAKSRTDVLDESTEDSKKLCKYSIEFQSYILEFRYMKKASVFYKPGSLYCVLKLRKNSAVYYHLTDIIPFLEHKTFKSCYFWNIESPERLKCCFKSLESTLTDILSQIEPFLSDDTVLKEALFQSYKTVYNLKPRDIDFEKIDNIDDFAHGYFLHLQKARDGYIFSRYCNFKPYALLLKNKTAKALAKYEKLNQKNKLLEYEKALTAHVCDSETREFHAFDPGCDTSVAYKFMSPVSGLKAFVLCFAVASVFFCGFCAVWNLIASAGTLVFLSAPWYAGFMCAALCSIFGAIAFFMYMPNKHLSKTERKNFERLFISKAEKKAAFIVFVLVTAVSIFFAVMIMLPNVRFYKDSLEFDDSSYNYSRIDSVYYIDARYGPSGNRIERGSYVILFDDKTSLDLDGYASVDYTEKEVLPLLKANGFEVSFADSERDLPWYTE